jgi:Flp pilus assembly protein TadD
MSRVLTLIMAVLLLAGCATAPVQAPGYQGLLADDAFERPAHPPDPSRIFALTPAMESFVVEQIQPLVHLYGVRDAVVQAMYETGRLKLRYDSDYTRTAPEAFQERAGNCLSLVILTAAVAKRMGLDVRFQRAPDERIWVRDGNLVSLVGHVNLSLAAAQSAAHRTQSPVEWLTIDFLPLQDAQHVRTVPVTEARIEAMYFNNRSVESLAGGRLTDAYWSARASMAQDPTFHSAYITLGVVLQRRGLLQRAEAAFRAALALEQDNLQALRNLAGVLPLVGKADEAAALQARLASVGPDPGELFQEGLQAYVSGNFPHARQAFSKIVELAPDDHEAHFMLGMSDLMMNEPRRALADLKSARDIARADKDRVRYDSKIQRLQEALDRQTSTVH